MMPARPTIHIIDDDDAMRDSLAFLLDVNGLSAHAHDSALAFLQQAAMTDIDCIIADLRMPGMSGLQLVRKLRADGINCPVIVITGHGDLALAVEALKAGVAEFIEKPFDDEELLAAVRNVLEARSVVDSGEKADASLGALSANERSVLAGLVSGRANKEIADDLNLSSRAVEVHRANLLVKSRARNLSELVRIALAAGF